MTTTEIVHPSELNNGDTIVIDNETYTLNLRDLKNDFFGWCFKGINLRNKQVKRVLYKKWFKSECIGFVAHP